MAQGGHPQHTPQLKGPTQDVGGHSSVERGGCEEGVGEEEGGADHGGPGVVAALHNGDEAYVGTGKGNAVGGGRFADGTRVGGAFCHSHVHGHFGVGGEGEGNASIGDAALGGGAAKEGGEGGDAGGGDSCVVLCQSGVEIEMVDDQVA